MSPLPSKNIFDPNKIPPPKKNTEGSFYEVQTAMCTKKHCTKMTLSALQSVHCALCTVHYTKSSALFKLNNAHYTLRRTNELLTKVICNLMQRPQGTHRLWQDTNHTVPPQFEFLLYFLYSFTVGSFNFFLLFCVEIG